MEKHELVGITLQRLIYHFKESPESFEFHDGFTMGYTVPTIIFRPKIQLSDHSSTVVADPNNEHAVVVCFNPNINEISCHIFMKATASLNVTTADISISSCRWFEKLRSNYRKFESLRVLIAERDQFKHNRNYLKKLSSVFPDTMDNHLL